VFKDRRDTCAALNTEARRFQQALRSYLSENRDWNSAELDKAWLALTSRYSEAQIILPEPVVAAAGEAWGELRYMYDRVVEASRREGSSAIEAAERDKLKQRLDNEDMEKMRVLRKAMRADLGISDLPLNEL
jgi:hypothetical protein